MYTCVCFKCPASKIKNYIQENKTVTLQQIINNLDIAKQCQLCLQEIKQIYMIEKNIDEFNEELNIPKKQKKFLFEEYQEHCEHCSVPTGVRCESNSSNCPYKNE